MANMINVLNTILANGSADYQARIPKATKDNLSEVGQAIMKYQVTENEFLSALVNKVAMTIVHSKTFKNPLSVLKKGGVPLGKNIEEIFTNPATSEVFDPTGATLLNRNIPDVKAIYHSMNRQGKYKVTVSKAMMIQAFTSYEALEKLLNNIVNSIYSGDNLDEFILMKNLVASGIEGGKIKTVEVDEVVDIVTAKSLVKAIKTIGQDMAFPSSKYNCYKELNDTEEQEVTPVVTWTPIENQVLILRNDISVEVDVELLAKAFNVSYTDLKQRTLIVDNFGTDNDTYCMLCDEALFQVYDNLQQMENFHNGEGLYDNYIYHHWQTYSLSLFANAIAFKKKATTTEATD